MQRKHFKDIAKFLYWNTFGVIINNPVLCSNIQSILFVCKGNICRSPFAEQIILKYNSNSTHYECSSAGIYVEERKSPPPEAIILANSYGVDLKDHRSRQINYSLMESFDMVIVMEVWQFVFLKKLFLEFREKIYLLPLFDKNQEIISKKDLQLNIFDPYGKSLLQYKECFNRIERCIGMLLDDINITKQSKIN